MRDAVKAVARSASLLLVLPALASYWLKSQVLGRDRAIEGSSQTLSMIPGVPGQFLRRAFLSQVLKGCGPSTVVAFGTIFSKADAVLEDGVYVGPGCFLGLVHLERDVLIGSGVHITSGRHTHGTADAAAPIRGQEGQMTLVRVGAGSWIGSAAVVMADVGRRSIVGAGAVVTKPIPDGVIAAGVPAVVVRERGAAASAAAASSA